MKIKVRRTENDFESKRNEKYSWIRHPILHLSLIIVFFSTIYYYAISKQNIITITKSEEIKLDLVAEGNTFYQLGKYHESIKFYLKEISEHPSNSFAWANLGNSYRELGRYELSISSHRKAVELTPDRPRSHYNLGVSLQTNNELIAAIESYKIAIQLDPSFLNAHYNMGLAYQELGELPQAINSYKQTLYLDPYHIESRLNYCNILYAEQMLEIAEKCYQDILTINSQYTRAIVNLAALYHSINDHNQAVTYYTMALEIDPENTMASHSLAAIKGIDMKQPDSMYIEQLFDSYSFHFESSLSKLEYQSPQQLAQALLLVLTHSSTESSTSTTVDTTIEIDQDSSAFSTNDPSSNNDINILKYNFTKMDILQKYENLQLLPETLITSTTPSYILDLGCGTGLMCPLLRNISHTIIGVDISSKMVLKAKAKNCYDELVVSEINSFLSHGLLRNNTITLDVNVILAADVLVYFGVLEELFQLCKDLLLQSKHDDSGRYFAFTVESLDHYYHHLQQQQEQELDQLKDEIVPPVLPLVGGGGGEGYENKNNSNNNNIFAESPPSDILTNQKISITSDDSDVTNTTTTTVTSLQYSSNITNGKNIIKYDNTTMTYKILSSGRYAHSKYYINHLADSVGYQVVICDTIVLRLNNNQPVIGYMVILSLPTVS